MTQEEITYLVQNGAYEQDVNTPLIIARWLSHDVASVAHRVQVPTLIAAMEANIAEMVEAFRHIDELTEHPVPWPYTHLTQFFLVVITQCLLAAQAPTFDPNFGLSLRS